MAKKNLTAVAVANMKPGKERRDVPDGACPGLYLSIEPSGTKRWVLRFRRPGDGRSARLVLGSVHIKDDDRKPDSEPKIGGHMTLGSVRQLVAKLRNDILQGKDPAFDHLAAKQNLAASDTFEDAARDFVEQHAKRHTRRWVESARMLGLKAAEEGELEVIKGSLCSRWGKRPLSEISEDDVFRVTDEARSKGVPGIKRRNANISEARARAVYSALSVMFAWLRERRKIKVNPVAGLKAPGAPKARDRVLSAGEIVHVWAAADAQPRPYRAMYRLLLLTGCRLNEVARMEQKELSDDGATWTIPGQRTKNGRAHIVPLPQLARDVIASAKEDEQHDDDGGEQTATMGPYVLSTMRGRVPLSGFSKSKKQLDEEIGKKLKAEAAMAPWRIHDLRRTAATGMAEIGIAPHVVEAVLNHVSGARAGVAGTYNRSALMPERKAALERWAEHVASLVAGRKAKVVDIQQAVRP